MSACLWHFLCVLQVSISKSINITQSRKYLLGLFFKNKKRKNKNAASACVRVRIFTNGEEDHLKGHVPLLMGCGLFVKGNVLCGECDFHSTQGARLFTFQ
jgi:hypothetical protein